MHPVQFGMILPSMDLTLHIPDALAERLADHCGLSGARLEEVTLSILSKLADEPSIPENLASRSAILNRLTERLTAAGVYDLPAEEGCS